MLFPAFFHARYREKQRSALQAVVLSCKSVIQTDRQSVSQSASQSGQFWFSTKILPVSVWCNSIVKFYLEMSASPSGCVLAVIVLSISTAPACLLPLPLVKPRQRARGEERWWEGERKREDTATALCASPCSPFVRRYSVFPQNSTSACLSSHIFTYFHRFYILTFSSSSSLGL